MIAKCVSMAHISTSVQLLLKYGTPDFRLTLPERGTMKVSDQEYGLFQRNCQHFARIVRKYLEQNHWDDKKRLEKAFVLGDMSMQALSWHEDVERQRDLNERMMADHSFSNMFWNYGKSNVRDFPELPACYDSWMHFYLMQRTEMGQIRPCGVPRVQPHAPNYLKGIVIFFISLAIYLFYLLWKRFVRAPRHPPVLALREEIEREFEGMTWGNSAEDEWRVDFGVQQIVQTCKRHL